MPFGAAPLSADQLDNAPPILIAFGLALVFYLLKRGTGLEVREVPPGEIMALFQFSEQPAKPFGPLVNIKTQVRWRWPSLYLQWQMPTSQVAGGIALLLILVAIIGAGLVTNPELRSLR